MKTYSQANQDLFILSIFEKGYKGTFVDIGCGLPMEINNSLLLEENGWKGIGIDKEPLYIAWRGSGRITPFICCDALKTNYLMVFERYHLPKVIDYLSIDIEGEGNRFKALQRVMETGYVFKALTVEHDVYCGYDLTERQPQRELLGKLGYFLFKPDVEFGGNAFEDWWINPKFIII